MPVYVNYLEHWFQPPLMGFFYDILTLFNVALMQLQPKCWACMSTYFLECNVKDLTVALDGRVFIAAHFLKSHKNCYTLDVRPTYNGYISHIKSKFKDLRKLFVLIEKNKSGALTTHGVRVAGSRSCWIGFLKRKKISWHPLRMLQKSWTSTTFQSLTLFNAA